MTHERSLPFDRRRRQRISTAPINYSPNSTWLVTSSLDTTRHVRRVERVETSVSSRAVRRARHSQNTWARHVERVVSRRDVTSRVEFGLMRSRAPADRSRDVSAWFPALRFRSSVSVSATVPAIRVRVAVP